jgi:hypothetical protein
MVDTRGPTVHARKLRGPLDTSGPTCLATLPTSGGTEYVRLWVREDGVVVALPMLDNPGVEDA